MSQYFTVEAYPGDQERTGHIVHAVFIAVSIPAVWVFAGYCYARSIVDGGHLAILFSLILCAGLLVQVAGRLQRRGTGGFQLAGSDEGKMVMVAPYSTPVYWGHCILMCLMTVMAGWLAGGRLGDTGGVVGDGPFIMLGIVTLTTATFPLAIALGMFRRGWVALSPHGVYQRGWTFESYLPWSAVISLHPFIRDHGPVIYVSGDESQWARRQILPVWTKWWDRVPPIFQLAIPAKHLGVDGAVLYRMISYYHQVPEARGELSSEEAVRKARSDWYPYPGLEGQ